MCATFFYVHEHSSFVEHLRRLIQHKKIQNLYFRTFFSIYSQNVKITVRYPSRKCVAATYIVRDVYQRGLLVCWFWRPATCPKDQRPPASTAWMAWGYCRLPIHYQTELANRTTHNTELLHHFGVVWGKWILVGLETPMRKEGVGCFSASFHCSKQMT